MEIDNRRLSEIIDEGKLKRERKILQTISQKSKTFTYPKPLDDIETKDKIDVNIQNIKDDCMIDYIAKNNVGGNIYHIRNGIVFAINYLAERGLIK